MIAHLFVKILVYFLAKHAYLPYHFLHHLLFYNKNNIALLRSGFISLSHVTLIKDHPVVPTAKLN